NSMIGVCNLSWVEEFYANSFGRDADDFTSYVRGVEISYAPDVIDAVFGFREEEHCSVVQRHSRSYTDEQYAMMLHDLALPGKDWRYNSTGARARL
ncbi:hypothetical protein A2U01_0075789, partial [Trifolium medium]|nr:hypothetical protein [Trifolium medium]